MEHKPNTEDAFYVNRLGSATLLLLAFFWEAALIFYGENSIWDNKTYKIQLIQNTFTPVRCYLLRVVLITVSA